jgi:hypothetical protein
VYHHDPQFLLIRLHSIGSKCKLINFNQYNLRVYTQNTHFLWRSIALYTLPAGLNLVACPQEPLFQLGVPWERKCCRTHVNRPESSVCTKHPRDTTNCVQQLEELCSVMQTAQCVPEQLTHTTHAFFLYNTKQRIDFLFEQVNLPAIAGGRYRFTRS